MRAVFAADISPRYFLVVAIIPFFPVPPPQRLRVAPVSIVCLDRRVVPLHLDGDRESLVVAPGEPLQFIHPGDPLGGDCVQLPGDALTAAGEVEEEGDAVGSADEGETVESPAGANECRVTGGHKILHEDVVGETLLEGAVHEDEGRWALHRFRHHIR